MLQLRELPSGNRNVKGNNQTQQSFPNLCESKWTLRKSLGTNCLSNKKALISWFLGES